MSPYRNKVVSTLLLCIVCFCTTLFADNNNETLSKSQNLINEEYKLGSGDLIKITVFNQEDLSGEYTINGAGKIALPLIGDVETKDLTVKQVEEGIANKLKPDYLLNPRVNVQVLNYRPFYILGEVKGPQSYPYVDGMTYLNAVAIAGGYTYRAKENHVIVIRMNDRQKKELRLNMNEKVLPGDVIHVEERFF
ncbi:polysaccharide biosynthesis/export family protein [Methylobacter sp. S3L5C]|uniref:polysaccharide biosynthesis/export family protein n=1 Tax=Methylobacter sp. S3L5C TaxID=2839024 RepID=UPI001FAC16C0|nr:polysaccharide biosynthesis/export family protein [Methylobacter sp. S3L5C]UOA08268.1 polysaccharide export protein [Methylobacter sp. S3L5C]